MMPETLTLEQAQQLARASKNDFNPFSFEWLVNDANRRKYEHTLKTFNLKDTENVRIQRKR